MDVPQKRSGFFGGFRFSSPWRAAPPADKEGRGEFYRTVEAGHTPPMPRVGFNASPESPAKRASAAQMSSRKILEQPKGPSSKLSNVINSADFATSSSSAPKPTNFSSSTTPKATNFASLSTFNTRPGAYSSATTPRNMFRPSAAKDRPTFAFSPKVPYNTMKESFPPTTPGRGFRASTAEVNGRGLSKTASTNLFSMRISSPPPELSGEALAKQVPQNPGRVGSVYADEFLAHLVPPGLDDLQRRQWFCILDLRRLKYAADEIFVKKDWKLNILSFAKEYEKSRSLIMLRYGLYEFKTKASAEYEKQWQKDNGISTSDDESRPNGAQEPPTRKLKRRAEDELKDTPLKDSSANLNKRRATERPAERPPLAETTPLSSNKRKAEAVEEPDENQRAKVQKAPSASKSVMDKILNSSQGKESAGSKPLKALAQSSGALGATPKSNPFAATSKSSNGIFASSVSKATTSSTNIFAHLQNQSGNDEPDTGSESEGDETSEAESEAQDISQSDEPSVAVSGGVATPSYGGGLNSTKPAAAAVDSVSSTSSEPDESRKGLSLFERISRGPDGKALRYLPEDGTPQPTSEKGRSASPEKEQRAADYTWKPNGPLTFSSQTASPFKPSVTANPVSAPKDGATPKSSDSSDSQEADSGRDTPKTASSIPSIFVAKPQTPSTTAASSIFAPKPQGFAANNASSIFSQKPQEKHANSAASLFGQKSQETPATGVSSIFAQNKPADAGLKPVGSNLFGQPKADDQKSAAPSTSAATLFGAKPKEAESSAAKSDPVFQSQTLFGAKADGAKSPPKQNTPFTGFTTKAPEESAAGTPQASSIFAANVAKPTRNIFASTSSTAPTPAATSSEQSAPKPALALTNGQPASSIFAANLFKPTAGTETEKNAPAIAPKNPFGGFAALAGSGTQESKPLFGAAENTQAGQGNAPGNTLAPTPATSNSIFNFGASNSQPTVAATSFGSVGTSFTSVGSGDQPKFHNPFATGGENATSVSFDFGSTPSSGAQGGSAPFVFGGGPSSGGNEQPASSGSFIFGGGAPSTSSAPSFGTQNTAPTISFGAGSQSVGSQAPQSSIFGGTPNGVPSGGLFNFGGTSQPNGPSVFSSQKPPMPGNIFNLAPPAGGTSTTGTNSPFAFGGASSLATTPATGTPEPGAEHEDGQNADGGEGKQEQISLTEGGPGEEDEDVVHEVRAKAMKLVMNGSSGSGSEEEGGGGSREKKAATSKSPWRVQGIGPFRLLKHKTTGAVRMLLRQEPSGRVALNKAVLPDFNYKTEPPAGKYIKLTTANNDGSGLETWMLQLKTKEAAQAVVDALEANKGANKK